ncbi:MAG: GntR family transcriptional regulator [Acetobacteraceae bacterium]|nr:GntR family transcriptional regulator [Acetobacteraceae bacterium]
MGRHGDNRAFLSNQSRRKFACPSFGAPNAMTPAITLPSFAPVEYQTLRDNAYAQLREALMTGQFIPGQRVTIRGLAAALGMSPTPIREAVRRLAAERAIEAEPNRWMRIPILTAAQLRELRAIRLALEGLAAEEAARRITPAEIAEVQRHEAEIVALRPLGDPKQMIPRISRLHFAIYRASAMPDLVRIIESLWLRSAPYSNLLFPGYTRMEKGRLRAAVIAALKCRDALEARNLIQADIAGALDYILTFADRPTWPKIQFDPAAE